MHKPPYMPPKSIPMLGIEAPTWGAKKHKAPTSKFNGILYRSHIKPRNRQPMQVAVILYNDDVLVLFRFVL